MLGDALGSALQSSQCHTRIPPSNVLKDQHLRTPFLRPALCSLAFFPTPSPTLLLNTIASRPNCSTKIPAEISAKISAKICLKNLRGNRRENLLRKSPQKSPAKIARENLPGKSAANICRENLRENLPGKSAAKICRENLYENVLRKSAAEICCGNHRENLRENLGVAFPIENPTRKIRRQNSWQNSRRNSWGQIGPRGACGRWVSEKDPGRHQGVCEVGVD